MTLALHYVRQGESLVSVLEALKTRLDELGISVGLWLADRAFCSVAALRWFDQQVEAIVPMVARGKKDPPSGSRVLFAQKKSSWTDYTMKSDTDGQFTFEVAVVRRYSRPSRSGDKRIPPTTKRVCCSRKTAGLPTTKTVFVFRGRNLSSALWH